MSYSKTILIGRVGNNPELKQVGSGSVLSFRVATDESWSDKNGERQKRTTWHQCDLWGKRAEALQPHIHKGDRIGVEGTIQHREYEKDGQNRYATSIKLTDVTLLGDRRDKSSNGDTPRGGQDTPPDDFDDSDIPF